MKFVELIEKSLSRLSKSSGPSNLKCLNLDTVNGMHMHIEAWT